MKDHETRRKIPAAESLRKTLAKNDPVFAGLTAPPAATASRPSAEIVPARKRPIFVSQKYSVLQNLYCTKPLAE